MLGGDKLLTIKKRKYIGAQWFELDPDPRGPAFLLPMDPDPHPF